MLRCFVKIFEAGELMHSSHGGGRISMDVSDVSRRHQCVCVCVYVNVCVCVRVCVCVCVCVSV